MSADYLWGSVTVCFGVLFYFVVPDNQAEAHFLTPRQKYIAVERLRVNQCTSKVSLRPKPITDLLKQLVLRTLISNGTKSVKPSPMCDVSS